MHVSIISTSVILCIIDAVFWVFCISICNFELVTFYILTSSFYAFLLYQLYYFATLLCVQIFSVDSSYSNNTQWPESQLNAIFSTDASFISDTSTSNTSACNTSETKYGILATPLRDDEKWVTFEHYCQQHPVNSAAVGLLQSGEGVGASVGSNAAACTATGNSSAIPPSAHTRSLLCIAEFLFVFAREPIGDSTAECVVQLHGVLSQGSHYYCCLSGSSDCALHMCVAPHSDPYMGRQVKCYRRKLLYS